MEPDQGTTLIISEQYSLTELKLSGRVRGILRLSREISKGWRDKSWLECFPHRLSARVGISGTYINTRLVQQLTCSFIFRGRDGGGGSPQRKLDNKTSHTVELSSGFKRLCPNE